MGYCGEVMPVLSCRERVRVARINDAVPLPCVGQAALQFHRR
jgi:hypothetical protein